MRLLNLPMPSPDAAAFAGAATGAVLITGRDDGRLLCALLEQFIPEPWAPVVSRCVVVGTGVASLGDAYQSIYPYRLALVEADQFTFEFTARPDLPQRFDWAWHAEAPDLDGFEELHRRYAPYLAKPERRQGCAGLAALESEWRPSGLPWWRG